MKEENGFIIFNKINEKFLAENDYFTEKLIEALIFSEKSHAENIIWKVSNLYKKEIYKKENFIIKPILLNVL
jgi:spore coat polysaccharide biosynthesis predicted glycosyltransferase SpsG